MALKPIAIFKNRNTNETEVLAEHRDPICGRFPLPLFLAKFRQLTGREFTTGNSPTLCCELSPLTHQALVRRLEEVILFAPNWDKNRMQGAIADALAQAVAVTSDFERECESISLLKMRRLVTEAREIASAHPTGAVSMSMLCRETGVTAPTLIKAFRSITGKNSSKYFALQRLSRVHEMLSKGGHARSAEKASSLANGFNDLGRFGSLFRSVYGVLPSEFPRGDSESNEAMR
ncbi:helix-turn-helix domain-containing protein [Primorskyibacter sp. S87]|uniref:helix-turn-helix domain-containing protein n=1 Tax=Primorskyibacter sp. S87 TaxID=3415126 RepID=UPI003C79E1CE